MSHVFAEDKIILGFFSIDNVSVPSVPQTQASAKSLVTAVKFFGVKIQSSKGVAVKSTFGGTPDFIYSSINIVSLQPI